MTSTIGTAMKKKENQSIGTQNSFGFNVKSFGNFENYSKELLGRFTCSHCV
jgi:hypothetical protein